MKSSSLFGPSSAKILGGTLGSSCLGISCQPQYFLQLFDEVIRPSIEERGPVTLTNPTHLPRLATVTQPSHFNISHRPISLGLGYKKHWDTSKGPVAHGSPADKRAHQPRTHTCSDVRNNSSSVKIYGPTDSQLKRKDWSCECYT
jgi:hypothetical protein